MDRFVQRNGRASAAGDLMYGKISRFSNYRLNIMTKAEFDNKKAQAEAAKAKAVEEEAAKLTYKNQFIDLYSILTADNLPTVDDFLNIPWIVCDDPGVYFCLGRKWKNGELVDIGLKIGCAWTIEGGMRKRKVTHENNSISLKSAETWSRSHIFRQSVQPGEVVQYHWGTLARGKPFRREDTDDEARVAIWYEIETVLSSAFGAAAADARARVWSAMRGWPWKESQEASNPFVLAASKPQPVDFSWRGFDGHPATIDMWANSGEVMDDEERYWRHRESQNLAAQARRDSGAYVCPVDGCPSDPFEGTFALERHAAVHDDVKRAELRRQEKRRENLSKTTARYVCEKPGCETNPPFTHKGALEAHQDRVHGILPKGLTKTIYERDKKRGEEHIAKGTYCCTVKHCKHQPLGMGFPTKAQLENHLMLQHKQEIPGGEKFWCKQPGCMIWGLTQYKIDRHAEEVHKITMRKDYACLSCPKRLTTHTGLVKHQKKCKLFQASQSSSTSPQSEDRALSTKLKEKAEEDLREDIGSDDS